MIGQESRLMLVNHSKHATCIRILSAKILFVAKIPTAQFVGREIGQKIGQNLPIIHLFILE
jgi:hypothetical protein